MPSIDQLKLLVNLAYADGEVTEKEKKYIINIGQANHFLVAEILPLLSEKHRVTVLASLSQDEKFDYMFHLVQLMKIDEKIYKDEIKYCAKVASGLGYRADLVLELLLDVKNVNMDKGELADLKKLTATYLRKS
jgi:uncharacterized tellurite resistance protein B-like protein